MEKRYILDPLKFMSVTQNLIQSAKNAKSAKAAKFSNSANMLYITAKSASLYQLNKRQN